MRRVWVLHLGVLDPLIFTPFHSSFSPLTPSFFPFILSLSLNPYLHFVSPQPSSSLIIFSPFLSFFLTHTRQMLFLLSGAHLSVQALRRPRGPFCTCVNCEAQTVLYLFSLSFCVSDFSIVVLRNPSHRPQALSKTACTATDLFFPRY